MVSRSKMPRRFSRRCRLGIPGLLEINRERAQARSGKFCHQPDDRRRIESTGKKRPHRDIGEDVRPDGILESRAQLMNELRARPAQACIVWHRPEIPCRANFHPAAAERGAFPWTQAEDAAVN